MRLTKRQLKRIIREEYARLKRRGLIQENYAPGSAMSELKFFARDKVESAGWETILRNMEMYDRGDFVRFCEECGCSSDAQMQQCILDYADGMDDREVESFTDYIAHFAGRF